MTSWPEFKSLSPVDIAAVGSFVPAEVLYEFEGPCIFTTRTPQNTLVLAYLVEELDDEDLLRFIVATTSESTVAAMKDGAIAVREALERGSLWLVDLDLTYKPHRAAACRAEDLPDDALPGPSTMLWPALEPALVVRLDGPEIYRNNIPPAVLAQAAEISSTALKPTFEWAARSVRGSTSGRPPDWLRHLYGLPAQRIAYGSLELAFRVLEITDTSLLLDASEAPSAREIQENGWNAVREGLEWSVSEHPTPPGDPDKWRAILEAMKRLAPATKGPIHSVLVSGRHVGAHRQQFQLTQASTKRIRSALMELRRLQHSQLKVFTGRVRDLDLDKLTFILRDVHVGPPEVQLVLADGQLLEDAREAHYQEVEVSVVARSNDGKVWTVSEIDFATGEPRQPT